MRYLIKKKIGVILSENNINDNSFTNINGPCCMQVPRWIKNPLGKYYLYFSDHNGKEIKLAVSNNIEGPWKMHVGNVLDLEKFVEAYDHIASPEIFIDDKEKSIRLYFHSRSKSRGREQWTFAAKSKNGINFLKSCDFPLAPFYLRIFKTNNMFYGMTKGGILWRSIDGVTKFEQGHNPFDKTFKDFWFTHQGAVRHIAFNKKNKILEIFYSLIGDAPEKICLSVLDISNSNWSNWKITYEEEILRPTEEYEGANLPIRKSMSGPSTSDENAVRDPYFIEVNNKKYLFYSVKGEKGIALAQLIST